MKEAYRILPVWAGDVSGIASALYELGGMVVIHDPSGCNSTYNTHDEIRWYDQESYIFLSGLNMRDAVLGNDKKFIDDIVEAFYQLDPHPRFIAVCNSPVPYLTGTDFKAICRIVESRCHVRTFYVPSNGMYDYVHGAGLAFLQYAKNMLPERRQPDQEKDTGRIRVSILGATPLTYGNRRTVPSLRRLLEKDGFEVVSVWAMGSSPEEIERSICTDVNLVISDTGLPAAEYLRQHYGIPCVTGAPVPGRARTRILRDLRAAARPGGGKTWQTDRMDGYAAWPHAQEDSGQNIDTYRCISMQSDIKRNEKQNKKHGITKDRAGIFIGEAVLAKSLAADWDGKAYVLCPFPDSRKLLDKESGQWYFDGEEELLSLIRSIRAEDPKAETEIFADPMYGLVLPEDVKMHPLPALAASGRMYQAHFPDYFAESEAGLVPGEQGISAGRKAGLAPGEQGISAGRKAGLAPGEQGISAGNGADRGETDDER